MFEARLDLSGDWAARRRQSPWWGVHAARYLFAAPLVRSGRVLDVACGTGYGLPILRAGSRVVVGLDGDHGVARHARAEAKGGGGSVIVGDGQRLPFRDSSFDAITSFETIEHLHDRDRFLAELRRVLSAGGLLILSTPNANHTRPRDGKPRNPHHVHEYTPGELVQELKRRFNRVDLLGQTLHPRFELSPFIDDQDRLPRSLGVQARLMLWRLLSRLPARARDGLSACLWGRPFYPGETDYEFGPSTIEIAPVLVALCRHKEGN